MQCPYAVVCYYATSEDWKPIMGRAVTMWSVESGVQLLDFHPPEWAKWLSISFYEELCKLPNWSLLLERGYRRRRKAPPR